MSGLKKAQIATAVSCAITAMLVAPMAASAGPVEDLVNQVSNGVNQTVGGLLGGSKPGNGRTPQPRGDGGSEYTPPAHGTNPHGMGTVGVVDESLLTPDPETLPLPYDPVGGSESVVIGQSRGEQNPDGTYHGHVTLVAVPLLGYELVGADTDEGESEDGPAGPLNDALDDLCADTGYSICLQILDVDSETDENGSQNSFTLASAGVLLGPDLGLFAEGGSSSGEISEQDGCQTADGESHVASVELPFAAIEGGSSESQSEACNDGTTSQENESSTLVFDFIDRFESLEALSLSDDCENGVPNTPFIDLGLVLAICGADDSSTTGGTQLDDPYGVREAFTLLAIDFLDIFDGESRETLGVDGIPFIVFLKTTLAAAESFAVAPPEEPPPPTECPDASNPDCPVSPPPPVEPPNDQQEVQEELTSSELTAPRRPTARRSGTLPFTGSDMAVLGLIGIGVMGTGLGLMALSDRRRRVGS